MCAPAAGRQFLARSPAACSVHCRLASKACMKVSSCSYSWQAAPGVVVCRKTLDGVLQAHALAATQHVVPQLRRPAAAEHLAERREALPAPA